MKSVEFSFRNNRLAASQSLGIINIIPKGDKDKRYLCNWRPLTLLDTLYKIISGCIAERIKPALNTLIHSDQKGFVAGRYIGEVVRTTSDITEFAKENNTSGIILLIDFEKAYDSISFSYINKCLRLFNFCDDMLKWIGILLHNFKALTNHCGNFSSRFDIGRGCRQGDPIASYLFILCIEILAHKLRTDPNIRRFSFQDIAHLLEIYADDMTIFLHPTSSNLRNTINVLDNFFSLSGLKISVTKTKAIWFGANHSSDQKLCPDLSLKWVKEFVLLGITFDNNLVKMQQNFEIKIEEIEKLLSHWSYRYLTPFGKVTIIKSLALSKLSHVALVIPNPTKQMFKRIENIFYKFLWGNNKSEKVNREDTKLPEKFGGLGLPDIEQFWLAFKFSWLRRILTTESFWPSILLSQVSKIQNKNTSASQLLELGPCLISKIAKSLKNKFWVQVLQSTIKMAEGAVFCKPEMTLFSSFWYNPFIRRNNKIVKYEDFPEIKNKIVTLSDFYHPGTNNIMSHTDFQTRYNLIISDIKYIDIRFTINLAFQKLNFPPKDLICATHPFKPTLIDIALATNKGRSTILNKKRCLQSKIGFRDEKWHTELQSRHSVDFWDRIRKLNSSISFNNNIKGLQFQIIRNSLQTNYIVSHFIRNVSPLCQYCNNFDEKISHLYWGCVYVHDFLNETFLYIRSTGMDYAPTKTEFLFGNLNETFNHPKNYISLLIKKYIWATKFKSAILSIVGIKNFIKSCLRELKMIFVIKEKADLFNEWIILYSDLCQVGNHAGNPVQTPPPEVQHLLRTADTTHDQGASAPLPQLPEAVQDPPEGGVQLHQPVIPVPILPEHPPSQT